ncbi:MAG TPA: hypothetical protein VHM25_14310 [Polyangiaceae bacterium]|nr:hypothetical protein [Polyangiaceae bacterium]
MKRTLQCAFAVSAMLASSSAWAQSFGEKGTIAISAERLFGFTYDSGTATQNGQDTKASVTHFSLLSSPVSIGGSGGNAGVWAGYSTPRVAGDYFIIDRLSLGAALGYAHWSATVQRPGPGGNETTATGDSFTFAPRVGYFMTFTDKIGWWPRGGLTYRSYSAENAGGHDIAFTLESPFAFTLFPHAAFWAGPTVDIGFTGSQHVDAANGTTTSVDFNAFAIGLQTGMVIYFGT